MQVSKVLGNDRAVHYLLLEVAISLEDVLAIVFGVKFGFGMGIVLAYYGGLSNGLIGFSPALLFFLLFSSAP